MWRSPAFLLPGYVFQLFHVSSQLFRGVLCRSFSELKKSARQVILCPYVRQDDSNILLSKRTWSTRAWCRLERLASQLHAGESNYMIEVRSARHHSLVMPYALRLKLRATARVRVKIVICYKL